MNDDENQPVNKITKITANNGSSVKVTVISVMFSFLCVPTKHCAWLYLFNLAYFLLRHVSTDNDHIHGWPTSNCRVNNKFGQSAVVSWMTVEDIFATQTYFLVVWSICGVDAAFKSNIRECHRKHSNWTNTQFPGHGQVAEVVYTGKVPLSLLTKTKSKLHNQRKNDRITLPNPICSSFIIIHNVFGF